MIEEQKKRRTRLSQLVQMVEKIGLKDLADERELMLVKWPDYKFSSPFAATSIFARCYREQYRRFYARDIDRNQAKHVFGSSPQRFDEPQEFASLWTQRRTADALGLRYDDYISFCMEFRLAKTDKTRRSSKAPPIPRPNQLGPSSASEAQQQAWQGKLEVYLAEQWRPQVFAQVAQLQQYRVEAYKDLPAQDAFRSLMLKAAEWRGGSWKSAMRQLCVDRHQVSRELFQKILKPDTYQLTCEHLDTDIRADPPKSLEPINLCAPDFWQSCFGVPGARDPSSPTCSSCPASSGCQKMADLVGKTLMDKYGTEDPVNHEKRRRNAEKVARHRLKKKEAGLLTGAA